MSMESVKIVVLGNGGIGKTCLLISYTTNSFPAAYVPTVFDNYSANVLFNGRAVNVCLWDTSGGEDYHRIRWMSYLQTQVFLVCFSVCRRETFNFILPAWYPEIREHGPLGVPLVLVGLKSDTRQSKQYLENDSTGRYDPEMSFVEVSEAHELARKIGAAAYVECSAYKFQNIQTVFDVALGAFFNVRLPLIPKQVSNSKFMSAIKKKVKKITIGSGKQKNTSKGVYDERLVISTPYSFAQYNRFGHAAVYACNTMFVFGGYKNMNNELIECPALWKGENAAHWVQLKALTEKFAPRAYACATLIHNPPISSTPLPSSSTTSRSPPLPSSSSSSDMPSSSTIPSSPSPSPPPHNRSDAKILIFGGKSNGYMNDIMCFDTESMDIEKLEITCKIPSPRYGMSGISYNDEMYMFGGYDKDSEPCNDCYKFNPEKREWSKIELTGNVPPPRFFHAAVCAADMQLMIVHGGKNGSNTFDDMYAINLETGECQQIAYVTTDLSPGPRQNHTCTYIGRGAMVFVGGMTTYKILTNDVFLFSLETLKWKQAVVKGHLSSLHSHAAVLVEDENEIWISGGKDDKESMHLVTKLSITLNTARLYDILPPSILRDILRWVPPSSLCHLCQVSHKFNELVNDKLLWQDIVTKSDPHYGLEKDGDPKYYFMAMQKVWYNDFTVPSVPPMHPYLKYV